jgi:hypothetical protein
VPLGLTLKKNSIFWPQSVFMCLVWFLEETAIIFLHGIYNDNNSNNIYLFTAIGLTASDSGYIRVHKHELGN